MTEIHPDMAGNQNRLKGRLSNQKCVIKLVNRQPVHPPLYRNWVGQLAKIKLWPTKLFPLFCLASGFFPPTCSTCLWVQSDWDLLRRSVRMIQIRVHFAL